MLRRIDDYRGGICGVYCSNEEEWEAILKLLGHPKGYVSYSQYGGSEDGKYNVVGIHTDNTIYGWGPKHFFGSIYPASDFLVEIENYEIY